MGIFFWSIQILSRQKQAWKLFAKRHDLSYDRGSVMSTATVAGDMNGYGLAVFSEAQLEADGRSKKFRTIIQFELPSGMPTEGVVATAGLREMASLLDLSETFEPQNGQWSGAIYLRTKNVEKFKSYLTKERVDTLHSLMSQSDMNAIFIFNEEETLLRVETPNPLDTAEKLERVINELMSKVKLLSL